jgi:hypothetical protein
MEDFLLQTRGFQRFYEDMTDWARFRERLFFWHEKWLVFVKKREKIYLFPPVIPSFYLLV